MDCALSFLGSVRNFHGLLCGIGRNCASDLGGVALREAGQTKPIWCASAGRKYNAAGVAPGLLVAGRGEILDGNLAERRPKIAERGHQGHGFGRARIEAECDVESSRILWDRVDYDPPNPDGIGRLSDAPRRIAKRRERWHGRGRVPVGRGPPPAGQGRLPG